MKMRKLLSMGALTLALVTCTSMGAFAAEVAGNRDGVATKVAANVWSGKSVVNGININSKTAVKKYVNKPLIDEIRKCVEDAIEDEAVAKKVSNKIQTMYDNNKSAKEMFEELSDINNESDITNEVTFKAAKAALEHMLEVFEQANINGTLETTIKKYFKLPAGTTLEYGRNSSNDRVVTLKSGSKIMLQVNSGNVYNLQDKLENEIHSWADLKAYYLDIK